MKDGFYSKKSALGVPNALILLMLIFFFVPFGARGARMALQKTENNVKDWLPSDFRETEELEWFAKKFVSEQFIIATWEDCREGDQRLKMFVSKLRREQAPDENADNTTEFFRAQQLGSEHRLFVADAETYNWGGRKEKWLVDESGQSYFITPNGRLYRWDGSPNVVGAIWRSVTRATGSFRLEGQFFAAFGDPGTEDSPNPFWEDPRLLAAPIFKTIETGPDLVAELAGEGGALYEKTSPTAGKRSAVARLTGTMFGPTVPAGFSWSLEDLKKLLTAEKIAELPPGWEDAWGKVVQDKVDSQYGGDLEKFRTADPVKQADVWYEFFDAMYVDEPVRQTCVVLTLTEAARANLGRVIGRGMLGQPKGRLFEIAEECGIATPPVPTTAPPPFSWLAAKAPVVEPAMRIGGPPVDNVAIDEEGTITLVRLIGYSLALGVGLSLILLRSARLMIMVFFVGGVSAMASLSLVWWCNASIDAILLTMPSLVYVLGMAGAIHIVNYYRDAALEKGQDGAPERAITHAVMPCTLAAVTTAIGLLSLCSSNILPIRKFGIFSAMGVMATLVLLYLYLPSALTIFPPKYKALKESGDRAAGGILKFWEAIGAFILRRHWWVNAFCITMFVGLGIGLTKIETDVQLLKLFDSKSQIIKDYGWLEENFGRLVPMELVVRFPAELQAPKNKNGSYTNEEKKESRWKLGILERAQAVAKVQSVLQGQFGYEGEDIVGRGMSAVTFVPDLPAPSDGYTPFHMIYNSSMDNKRSQMLESDFMAVEDLPGAEGTELWRISLRLGALNNVDYGVFVNSLRAVVEPVVASYRCRSAVLRNVVENKPVDRIVGNVLIIGSSRPATNLASLGYLSEEDMGVEEFRRRVFATSLKSCLTNETIGAQNQTWFEYGSDEKVRDEAWWAERLPKFDCVVLVKSQDEIDLGFLKKHAKQVVNAEEMLSSIDVATLDSHTAMSRPVELTAHAGEMDVVYTGVVPVVYKAQRTLLISLFESVAWAFVLIAFVMACLLSPARSFLGAFRPRNLIQAVGSGSISMIPNVFPVVIIFGIMGHSGWKVDIGSMMTASVAMGVAVDDTIHFLTWFRDGLRRGLDRRDAVFVAYKHVAPAMTQTTIIGGLGLSVFALSTFTPTQRFGMLMLALLTAALVGDLIFLPALLASPLGRIFSVRPAKKGRGGSAIEPAVDRTTEMPGASELAGEGGEYRLEPEESSEAIVRPPQMLRRDGPHVRRKI